MIPIIFTFVYVLQNFPLYEIKKQMSEGINSWLANNCYSYLIFYLTSELSNSEMKKNLFCHNVYKHGYLINMIFWRQACWNDGIYPYSDESTI